MCQDAEDPNETLPPAVQRALERLDDVPINMSSLRDQEILRAAHGSLRTGPRRPVGRRWWPMATVVATAAALLLVTALPDRNSSVSDQAAVSQLNGELKTFDEPVVGVRLARAAVLTDARDLDRNGSVDILDAYLLARRLQSGESGDEWDFDHNGQLDELDVKTLALAAVAL